MLGTPARRTGISDHNHDMGTAMTNADALRRYADCGHEWDGATDSGYCRRCESILREDMERAEAERQREHDAQPQRDESETTDGR